MTTVNLMGGTPAESKMDNAQNRDIFSLVSEIVTVLSSEGITVVDIDPGTLERHVERISRRLGGNVTPELLSLVKAHVVGYGLLDRFIADPTINNVYVNRYDDVWIQTGLERHKTDVTFSSLDNLSAFIRIMQSKLGGEINHDKASETFFDKDRNLRIVCVIEPVALNGPTVVIRIHRGDANFTLEDLIEAGMLTRQQSEYILMKIRAGANPVFAGIGGAGKTTIMRAFIEALEPGRRIMTMEEEAELKLKKSNVLSYLVKRNDRGQVIGMKEFIDLGIKSSIDTFVFGENRGEEALSLIMAAYSGHQVMLTLHTKAIRDVPERLAINMKMSGTDIPMDVLLAMIGRSVDLVIQMDKFKVVDIGVMTETASVSDQKGICRVTSVFQEVSQSENDSDSGVDRLALGSDNRTAV